MMWNETSRIVLALSLGSALWGATAGGQAPATQPVPPPPPRPFVRPTQTESDKSLRDPYQRSLVVYEMRTTGDGGAARGEEIYYYKCWICHNQYAKTGPPLAGLFKRSTLSLSGEPINDRTVMDKIRKGGPAMPSYGATLAAKDLDDLVSYIKSDTCCFDAENPPANPWYKGGE